MTDYERTKARQWQKHKENMKDPDYRAAYQEMERRKREREKSEEALKRFGAIGSCSQMPEEKPRERSANEMRHEEIVKLFS